MVFGYSRPIVHTNTLGTLGKLNVRYIPVEIANATSETSTIIGEKELAHAAQTALACDADVLVVTKQCGCHTRENSKA